MLHALLHVIQIHCQKRRAILDAICRRSCLLGIAPLLFFLSPCLISAQDPIHVQSNEVLVPTVVFDTALYAQLNKQIPHHRASYGHLAEKNSKLWQNIAVKGLTVQDFRLFEDGQEQKIQRVKLEPPAFREVQDNLGKHPEIVGSGGGLWAYPDLPKTNPSVWLSWPQYILSYIPPKSTLGSCHQIQVKVTRTNLTVWTRSEYCNTAHPANDPLSGTLFGKKLETAANAGVSNELNLKLKTAVFAGHGDQTRVYVSMTFPGQSLRHEFRNETLYATIGSMILIYRKDGTETARYSDFACCDYGDGTEPFQAGTKNESGPTEGKYLLPDRYEVQFSLPPGEYELRAVLSDGAHFGIQRESLIVASDDKKQLSISDVVLSRRVRKASADSEDFTGQMAESYAPLISKEVEYTPTAITNFSQDEMLFAYFEINDPRTAGSTGATVEAHLRIVDAESGKVVDTFDPIDTSSYRKADSTLIGIGRGIKMNRLPPGSYSLEVQASNAEGKNTAWSFAGFTVIEATPLAVNAADAEKKYEVILNLTATDSSGHPVKDLTGEEFQIFEDKKPQSITSFKVTSLSSPDTLPAPIVVLFDLVNNIPQQREYIASRIIKVLEPLETEEGIYLYLLTNEGDLYAVRPTGNLQTAPVAQGSPAEELNASASHPAPWTKEIRPLLNHAIEETHGFRQIDFKDSAIRAVVTFDRLAQIGEAMSKITGPKTILWVTAGVPNSIVFLYGNCKEQMFYEASSSYLAAGCVLKCYPNPSASKCMDYTPFLQHFSEEMIASDTIVSSVALSKSGLGNFDRGTAENTLRQLADSTGGQVYLDRNGDVEKALNDAIQMAQSRYQISFTEQIHDGKYHKLRVICTRSGVKIVGPLGRYTTLRPEGWK
jgi:VWFA-related protein